MNNKGLKKPQILKKNFNYIFLIYFYLVGRKFTEFFILVEIDKWHKVRISENNFK